jgi:hypothetical protein
VLQFGVVPLTFYEQMFMLDVFGNGSTQLMSGTRIGSVTSSKTHRVSSQDLGPTVTGREFAGG